jgi:hypothetical protein
MVGPDGFAAILGYDAIDLERHREERTDAAIQESWAPDDSGLLRFARNDA